MAQPVPADTGPPTGRGRPPMSERRRAIIRTEIARAAVALFAEKGVAATTGDDIAHAIGISTRTLWRYFPSKESCVRPLLTAGLDLMAERLRTWPRDVALLDHLERPGLFADTQLLDQPVADIVWMTRREPGVRAVWLDVHHEAEGVFAEILAERAGTASDDFAVRVRAATLNVALRLAAEEHVRHRFEERRDPPGGLAGLLRTALGTAWQGLSAAPDSSGRLPHGERGGQDDADAGTAGE